MGINSSYDMKSSTDRAKLAISNQLLDRKISYTSKQLSMISDGKNSQRFYELQIELDALVNAKESIKRSLLEGSVLDNSGKPIVDIYAKPYVNEIFKEGKQIWENPRDDIHFVYRVNDRKINNLYELSKEGLLDYFGYVKKGDNLFLPRTKKGEGYVIMRRPVEQVSLSSENAIYGIGWLKATADKNVDMVSEYIGKEPLDIAHEILQLKKDLN